MSSRRAAAHEFQFALARAAGRIVIVDGQVVEQQLELELAAPRFKPEQTCGECGRRGYHLAGCKTGRLVGGSR